MDFTYIAALFGSVIIGFVGALTFITFRGNSRRKLFLSAIAVTVALDFAFLIDWKRWDDITASFLLVDSAIFSIYAMFGTAVGAFPVLGMRWLYRRLKAEDTIWTFRPQWVASGP